MSEMSPFQPIKLQYVKPFEHLKAKCLPQCDLLANNCNERSPNKRRSPEKKLRRETSDTGSQVGAGSFMKVVQWRMKPKPVDFLV